MRLGTVQHRGATCAARLCHDHVLLYDAPRLDVLLADAGNLDALPARAVGYGEVELDAPLRPPVVLCAGQNYRDHLDEKAPVEVREPEFFLKAGQTIASPDAPCVRDVAVTRKLDYETELGVVIGRAGRHISAAQALDHVFGYLVVNDVTARDRQVVVGRDGRFGLALGPGKNFDGATRLAASVISADEIGDPQALQIQTTVNGELRQRNSTANMIFPVAEVIAYLSTLLTLRPGTIIATGSPGGTGWGQDGSLGGTSVTPPGCVPARYLEPGDVVLSVIEAVGELEFVVADAGSEASAAGAG